jgi:flagellar basal-body rod protein FlgG
MAIAALNSAATGLKALSTRIDVIANNLANAETLGFKRSRANFEELMYVTVRNPGTQNAEGDVSPAGIQLGLGVRVANTQIDVGQGPFEETGRQLDVAIEGPGFFRVQVLDGVGDGFAYTRVGNLFVNNEGELVIGSTDGYRIQPPVSIPDDTVDVTIATDGTVSVLQAGQIAPAIVGNIELARFINPQGLKNMGSNLYQETAASGTALLSAPGEDSAGIIRQNFLEGSNVDPVRELVTLIKTQRSFELNSQSIQTADQALQTVANLRRF